MQVPLLRAYRNGCFAEPPLIYFGRLVGVWCHGDDTIGPDGVEPASTCPFLSSASENVKKCLLVTAGLPVNVKQ
jgi:hypothetical protein